MNIRIQLIIDGDESTRRDVAHLERTSFGADTLGLVLEEAKAILANSQQALVATQAEAYLAQNTHCPDCRRPRRCKGWHEIVVRSLFSKLRLRSPRYYRCACRPDAPESAKSFSPLADVLVERTLPERLYLEAKWASLMSYGMTARLMEDVLPLEDQISANGVRQNAHRLGRRCEQEVALASADDTLKHSEPTTIIPPPKPAITVGIDGGYVRSRDAPSRREGWFEVIAGKSSVEGGDSQCFAFVHRHDRHA